MPNPINSETFEPAADGRLVCTSTFSVQQSGTSSDWGGSDPGTVMKLIRVSDGAVLATGYFQPATRTRLYQTYSHTFDVLASDGAQTLAVIASGGDPGTSIDYWDVTLRVEHIKR